MCFMPSQAGYMEKLIKLEFPNNITCKYKNSSYVILLLSCIQKNLLRALLMYPVIVLQWKEKLRFIISGVFLPFSFFIAAFTKAFVASASHFCSLLCCLFSFPYGSFYLALLPFHMPLPLFQTWALFLLISNQTQTSSGHCSQPCQIS